MLSSALAYGSTSPWMPEHYHRQEVMLQTLGAFNLLLFGICAWFAWGNKSLWLGMLASGRGFQTPVGAHQKMKETFRWRQARRLSYMGERASLRRFQLHCSGQDPWPGPHFLDIPRNSR